MSPASDPSTNGGPGAGTRVDAALLPDARPAAPDAGVGPDVCTPGETVCTGRVLNRCRETGDGFDVSAICPFTCEEDTHCTLASNIAEAGQRTCDASAPRLTPTAGAQIRFEADGDGRIVCDPDCGDDDTEQIDATLQEAGPVDLAWFCLSELDIPAGVTVLSDDGITSSLALLVAGRAVVAGTIQVNGGNASDSAAGAGGPGGAAGGDRSDVNGSPGNGACPGQGGQRLGGGAANSIGSGGGGAGYGDHGGTGGEGRTQNGQSPNGGEAGSPCGQQALTPLVGGSGGGGGGDGNCGGDCGWPGGGGGGAIQIAASGGVEITGTIRASGGNGFGRITGQDQRGGGGGGGAGGGILLEGPTVTVDRGTLEVEGGAGGISGAGIGGAGGAGGTNTGDAGASAIANGDGGAGGGGGGGRVRLNAAMPPRCGGTASPGGACNSGRLTQRRSIGEQ